MDNVVPKALALEGAPTAKAPTGALGGQSTPQSSQPRPPCLLPAVAKTHSHDRRVE